MNAAPPANSRRRSITRYAWWTAGFILCLAATIAAYDYTSLYAARRTNDESTQAKMSRARPQPTADIQANLIVPAEDLALGRLFDTSRHTHVVHITNAGLVSARIDRFEKSCDCAELVPSGNVTLGPGETSEFTLTLGLRPNSDEMGAGEGKPYAVWFN